MTTGTPNEFKKELLKGPITVAMTVVSDVTYYSGGVLRGDLCGTLMRFDHSVVIVGWNDGTCG